MPDSDCTDSRSYRMARLATLQRLREHAKAGNRVAMLKSIEDLIEQESRALREAEDSDAEPA